MSAVDVEVGHIPCARWRMSEQHLYTREGRTVVCSQIAKHPAYLIRVGEVEYLPNERQALRTWWESLMPSEQPGQNPGEDDSEYGSAP